MKKIIVAIVCICFLSACGNAPTATPLPLPTPKPTLPSGIKLRLIKTIEDFQAVASSTSQGVNYIKFADLLLKARSSYDLLLSGDKSWVAVVNEDDLEKMREALLGWTIAERIWSAKISRNFSEICENGPFHSEVLSYSPTIREYLDKLAKVAPTSKKCIGVDSVISGVMGDASKKYNLGRDSLLAATQ